MTKTRPTSELPSILRQRLAGLLSPVPRHVPQFTVCDQNEFIGYKNQSMKGFYLRYIGQRRNAATIGLINLIYNLARYEQIVWLKLMPLPAA